MDFGSFIDEEVNNHKTALTKSALIAHNTDPDKHVENINKAVKQGIHPSLATPATHPASLEEFNLLANEFAGTTGHTATALSDPEIAKKAKDSTENMGLMESLLKAIPRVVAHTAASFAQLPISGISAAAKLLHTGSLSEASKVLEDNQKILDDYYLTTPEERKGSENIGLAMKPFQMAGRGLAGIAELPTGGLQGATDVVEGRSPGSNIGVPIAGTIGEAAAMFGFGEIGKTRMGKMVAEHAQTIIDTAKKSPFRKRAPKEHSEFVDGIAKESEHPPFQMPVEKATEMYARTDKATPASIVTAKFEGTKVDVPVTDLVEHADTITPQDVKEMSVEGTPSVAELEKKAAEPESDIRPAVKVGDEIKTGADGERHTDIVKDAPEADRGFTIDGGKTMIGREEGAAWLKENKPELFDKLPEDQKTALHSEGLWQSQGIETPLDKADRPNVSVTAKATKNISDIMDGSVNDPENALRGVTEEDSKNLNWLRPASKLGDKTVSGKTSDTHYDSKLGGSYFDESDNLIERQDGFITPNGKFLTREEAYQWIKENQPSVLKEYSKNKDQYLKDDSGNIPEKIESFGYAEAIFRDIKSGKDSINKLTKEKPTDRRKDTDLRSKWDSLSEDEKFSAAHRDPLTGLKNLQSWEHESAQAETAGKTIISGDVSGMKFVNDKTGHEGGNALLKSIGDATREHGIDGYRPGGDEFHFIFDKPTEADRLLAKVNESLAKKVISAIDPEGATHEYTGFKLDYGAGASFFDADAALLRNRKRAVESGTRHSVSGQRPVGVAENITGRVETDSQGQIEKHTSDPAQPIAGGFLGNERGAIDLTGAVETAQNLSDYVTIDSVPRLKRAGVSDSAVAHASAKIAVPHIVDDLLSKAFPDSYKNPGKMSDTIDILNKDNILGGYDTFLKRASEAYESGDLDEASKFMALADAVREKHDLVQYDQDIREASDNPEIISNIQNWKKHVSPELDRLYNEMKGVDPLTERSGRGRYLDARINLLTEDRASQWMESMADGDKPMPEPSSSSYRNPNTKADRYDKHASFTGNYSDDARAVLANVIGPRWNEVTKLRLYNDLLDKGVAFTEPTEGYSYMPVKMPKTNTEGITHMADQPLWVRKDLVREVRDALNTDSPLEPNAVMKIATGIQLAQIADAVTHTKNIMTVVTKGQGAGSAFKDVIRKIPVFGTVDAIKRIVSVTKEVSGDSPAIRAEVAEMAKQGLVRPTFPPSGLQKITRGQQFIHAADTGARIVMNRFFDNLVERGLAEDSVVNRREFINQVGQYNKRLMGPLMKAAAQSGISPFIVAGRNFNRQGRWAVTGNPGVKAASRNAAFQMRMTNLLGTAALFTVPMMLNVLSTGKPGGRPGTPLGAWDLGTDEKNGKHKVIDLLQITGLRRGLKSMGIDAIAEGLRNGLTMEQITNNALQDAAQTVIHPWMGPALGGISKTVTGRQLDIRGHMDAQKIPGAGPFAPRQLGENFRAALESQNPLVYSMVRPALKKAGIDQKPDPKSAPSDFLKSQFGETGAVIGNIASTFAKSPQSAFGVKNVQKGKSAAAELITQYEKRGDAIEPTQEENYAAKKEAIDLLRNGSDWGDMPQELQDNFSRMSTKQRKAIEKQADQTDLQHRFTGLSADKAVEVWKLTTDAEREELEDIYKKKLRSHKKGLEGDDLDNFNEKIDAAEERRK
jgi:GGDEF domain-containing protein